MDTTMAFTPTAGLVMGTRPGDLAPGLLVYLMRSEKLSPDQMDQFISQQCGLLGISETTSDMQDLLKRRDNDSRATDAGDIFCYQSRKFIGALAATVGGLDTLVFSGGIGERGPAVRDQICDHLKYLLLFFDAERNVANEGIISRDRSKVVVHVIATNEEAEIAEEAVLSFLKCPKASDD
jgi:acetate kinase